MGENNTIHTQTVHVYDAYDISIYRLQGMHSLYVLGRYARHRRYSALQDTWTGSLHQPRH